MHNLESLLKTEINNNPEKYSKESIERVSKLARLIEERPERRMPYYVLEDIEDYQLIHHMHTEWIGKSTEEMQQDPNGGCTFYRALNRRVNKLAKGNKKYKKELLRKVFPQMRKDWFEYETLNDWKTEYSKHPEWIGQEVTVPRKDNSEVHTFYMELRKWAAKKAGDNKRYQKKLIRSIFPEITEGWMGYTKLEQWKRYYKKHPEWSGLNSSQMYKNPEFKGSNFCSSFHKWTVKEANGNEEYQKKLFESIFPRTKKDWKEYTNISDWQKYYDAIPKWKGKDSTYIRYDEKNHGNQFYCAVLSWTRREAEGDDEKRLILLKTIFGEGYILHTARRTKQQK